MLSFLDMPIVVRDQYSRQRLRETRIVQGSDRLDEVWAGTYVLMPMPDDMHQDIVGGISTALSQVIQFSGKGQVRAGTNVSDRTPHWFENYRCPDVAAMLKNGVAINCKTYWLNGPDFLVEVISPDDGALEKIPFYSQVGVRELLVIDRYPWKLELYRHDGEFLRSVGVATVENGAWICSEVVGLKFRLVEGLERPVIEVQTLDESQQWRI